MSISKTESKGKIINLDKERSKRQSSLREEDFHPTTAPEVLEEFRRNARTARVFDVDDPAQWGLVRPHLDAPEVVSALDRGMREMDEEPSAYGPWDPEKGPWQLTPSDFWSTWTDNRVYKSGWEWETPEGIEEPEPDEDGVAIFEGEYEEAYLNAFEEAHQLFYPQPGTPNWYRVVHGSPWIAPWCAAIGRRVFPDLQWSVIRGGDGHHTAWGRSAYDPAGVIMDVLHTLFANDEGRECTADEIVAGVLQERGRVYGGPSVNGTVRKLGEAIARLPGIDRCSIIQDGHCDRHDRTAPVRFEIALEDLKSLGVLGTRVLSADYLLNGGQDGRSRWDISTTPKGQDKVAFKMESSAVGELALEHADQLADVIEIYLRDGADALEQLKLSKLRPH